MRRVLLTLSAILLFGCIHAQIDRGGEPMSWKFKTTSSDIPVFKTDVIDLIQVQSCSCNPP